MINNEKCMQYYFDSNKYTESEIMEVIKQEEIGFEKKISKIDIKLNEYGIFVVKLKFINNKLIFKKIKFDYEKNEKKQNKKIKTKNKYNGYENYIGNDKIYGQYKPTKTYQPI